jgi:streptogramin lyase
MINQHLSNGVVLTAFAYSGFDSHAGPTGIVLGPDGNVWFVEYLTNSVGRVSL